MLGEQLPKPESTGGLKLELTKGRDYFRGPKARVSGLVYGRLRSDPQSIFGLARTQARFRVWGAPVVPEANLNPSPRSSMTVARPTIPWRGVRTSCVTFHVGRFLSEIFVRAGSFKA